MTQIPNQAPVCVRNEITGVCVFACDLGICVSVHVGRRGRGGGGRVFVEHFVDFFTISYHICHSNFQA